MPEEFSQPDAELSQPQPSGQCQNCHSQPVLPGYPTPICGACRQQLVRFPIPKWIWLFAGGILILMCVGLAEMPKYLSAARDQARGEKAYEERRYRSAETYLLRVLAKFPDHIEANGMLMVAALRNGHFDLVEKPQAKLENHKFTKDDDLLEQINAAVEQAQYDLPPADTSLLTRIGAIATDGAAVERLYFEIDSALSLDAPVVGLFAANALYEQGEYARSSRLIEKLLAQRPDWETALKLEVANKRNLGDYDGAMEICRQLQARTPESPEIASMQCRVELRRNKDIIARTYAERAMSLDSSSVAALESIAMVEHFEGQHARSRQRLDRIAMLEPATGDSTITVRLRALLDGTKSYR